MSNAKCPKCSSPLQFLGKQFHPPYVCNKCGQMFSENELPKEEDKEEVVVVFRKYKDGGQILALFPHVVANKRTQACMSYEHLGQHGQADYSHCISITKPAKPEEYKDLKKELERIGYILTIRTRK